MITEPPSVEQAVFERSRQDGTSPLAFFKPECTPRLGSGNCECIEYRPLGGVAVAAYSGARSVPKGEFDYDPHAHQHPIKCQKPVQGHVQSPRAQLDLRRPTAPPPTLSLP